LKVKTGLHQAGLKVWAQGLAWCSAQKQSSITAATKEQVGMQSSRRMKGLRMM